MTGVLGRDQLHRYDPARSLLAGLSTDPRVGWWLQRAVLSSAAGLVAGIWLDWRLALTTAAVVAVADTIYRSRTSAVIPATARVSSAQRRTRRRLARMSYAGYICLHARVIPGTAAVIDHLVVGPAGVYAFESQRWDRRLPVRAVQGGRGSRLYHGPFDQAARLEHVQWVAAQASRLISDMLGRHVPVRPALVIHGPVVPWIVAPISGVDVFRGRRLRTYLRREVAANRAARLDDRQIELVHAVAAQVLPPAR